MCQKLIVQLGQNIEIGKERGMDGARERSKVLVPEGSETMVKILGFYPEKSRKIWKGFSRGSVSPWI